MFMLVFESLLQQFAEFCGDLLFMTKKTLSLILYNSCRV